MAGSDIAQEQGSSTSVSCSMAQLGEWYFQRRLVDVSIGWAYPQLAGDLGAKYDPSRVHGKSPGGRSESYLHKKKLSLRICKSNPGIRLSREWPSFSHELSDHKHVSVTALTGHRANPLITPPISCWEKLMEQKDDNLLLVDSHP
ncbi:hypothetical protein PoB_005805400 [Plakobranchus ocellatus]|uniref:Uncharacterized protein n=1 Tax=Plakobranchus ocellatus TaxID=259542 RepID=A0AAV4CFT7_9GAST|nr:hypothetical protein PoB_005805400 [Plakobranchus ocellatus]